MRDHHDNVSLQDEHLSGIKHGGAARERAFSELRQRLMKVMSRKLTDHYRVDAQFVEDMVQETLVVVLDKLDTFRGESRFFTWVCSICVRLSLSEIRRKRWKDFSLDDLTSDSLFEPVSPHADRFTERLAWKEQLLAIKYAIDNLLTEKQRRALLAELEGISTDELARRVGTTRGAVYKLTHDARRSLVRHLAAAGYSLEED